MLSSWSGMSRERRRVERRLRAEAGPARVGPPPELRSRTLAALEETSPVAAEPRRRPGLAAYAVACGLVLLVAGLAVMRGTGSARPVQRTAQAPPPLRPAVRSALDVARIDVAIAKRFERWEVAWEEPLRAEARGIVGDARQAHAFLLARLPRPPLLSLGGPSGRGGAGAEPGG